MEDLKCAYEADSLPQSKSKRIMAAGTRGAEDAAGLGLNSLRS